MGGGAQLRERRHGLTTMASAQLRSKAPARVPACHPRGRRYVYDYRVLIDALATYKVRKARCAESCVRQLRPRSTPPLQSPADALYPACPAPPCQPLTCASLPEPTGPRSAAFHDLCFRASSLQGLPLVCPRPQVAMIGSGAWACAAVRMVAQNTLLVGRTGGRAEPSAALCVGLPAAQTRRRASSQAKPTSPAAGELI
jgi:hypothetical protein